MKLYGITKFLIVACNDLNSEDWFSIPPQHLSNESHIAISLQMVAKKRSCSIDSAEEYCISCIQKEIKNYNSTVEIKRSGIYLNLVFNDSFFIKEIAELFNDMKENKHIEPTHNSELVEYTGCNPFKEMHIGHLMSNAIGESTARISEMMGNKVYKVNYQGDIGIHVASAVWALMNKFNGEKLTPPLVGLAYAEGARAYRDDETAKKEIENINMALYKKNNQIVQDLYQKGREVSLSAFETLYKKLGTQFNRYYFESETGSIGLSLVEDVLSKNNSVFKKDTSAIISPKEENEVQTRVFVNSMGIPTYEAKELGLAQLKNKEYTDISVSITVSANEIIDYMRVVYSVMKRIPSLTSYAEKCLHIAHGVMKLPTGKMSSRTGDVFSAEKMIDIFKDEINAKAKTNQKNLSEHTLECIAISAIKYNILKHTVGKDIIFDANKETDLEGETGSYILYTLTRAKKIVHDSSFKETDIDIYIGSEKSHDLGKHLLHFGECIRSAYKTRSPHIVAKYTFGLAKYFNTWYASEPILNQKNTASKIVLVVATIAVLEQCIYALALQPVDEM
ncbi:MAG: arginine--tRNA ligase [Alphaproteobacteria bacterium]|nr:arginine--tRNA ligase [Alphaproteobacteria bacterium]